MPKNSEGYDWEQDKVSFMFVNLDHQGEDMHHSVNGRNFVIRDNKVNTAPRAVFNALNDCVRKQFKVEGKIDGGKETVAYEKKLYFCQIIEKTAQETTAEKEKADTIKEALEEESAKSKKAARIASEK